MILKPLQSTNWIEISDWCFRYNKYNKYPVSTSERFAIGIYQIHQGLDWQNLTAAVENEKNKAESYMSAFLHFKMAQLSMKLDVWTKDDITSYTTWPMAWSAERILYLISKCQQQIFYFTKMQKTLRGKSRYNPEILNESFHLLQLRLIALVPSHCRGEGLYNASKIMMGIL